jgi:hypothetical protein
MGAMIFPPVQKAYILDTLITAHGGSINMRLFTNDFTPTPLSVLADFVEPSYAGYGTDNFFYGPSIQGPDQSVYAPGFGTGIFQMANDLIPTSLFGYFFTDIGSGDLLFAGRFDDGPINFINVLQALYPAMRYAFAPRGIVQNTI